MADGGNRADLLTGHAGNLARGVYRNGIEGTGEPRFLRANGNTGSAFNARVPVNMKEHGLFSQS